MSFLITGMGEVYSGSMQKGMVLALIRIGSALAIPFYSIINDKNSYLTEIFFSILLFSGITLISPVNALIMSLRKKSIVILKFTSVRFIILFAICNLAATLTSLAFFFSFFTITDVKSNCPPVIEQGDIAVIKRIGNLSYRNGELVALDNRACVFARIIGQPGDDISYSKGRFTINDTELVQSIFTENEIKNFSLSDFDVISETALNIKYPVLQNRDQFKTAVVLKNNEYFTAPDDRNNVNGFSTVQYETIRGRMEGILFSVKRVRFLIKPFINAG